MSTARLIERMPDAEVHRQLANGLAGGAKLADRLMREGRARQVLATYSATPSNTPPTWGLPYTAKGSEIVTTHAERFGHLPVDSHGFTTTASKCVTCKATKASAPRSPRKAKPAPAVAAEVTAPEVTPSDLACDDCGRTTHYCRCGEVEIRRVPLDIPTPIAEYLARLVHAPKRAYAAAYVAHRIAGATAPDDPGAPWAAKARAKVDRLVTR